MIYAIRAVNTDFVKIGRAKSVGHRLNEIQTHSPFELEVLAVANYGDAAERIIHQYLEAQWERGEWFRLTPETWQVIEWMRLQEWSGTPLATFAPKYKQPPATKKQAKKRERAIEVIEPETPADLRRAQRRAWWKRNGHRLTNAPHA